MLDALYEALAVFAALPLFAAFTRSHRLLRDLARPSRCNVLAALYEALAVLRFYRCSPSLRRHDTRDMTGFPGDSTQEEVPRRECSFNAKALHHLGLKSAA